jgi:hypothetical protein
VVPPGTGILNIITTKEKAENMLSSGTALLVSLLLSLFPAITQKGIHAAYMAAQVWGLR